MYVCVSIWGVEEGGGGGRREAMFDMMTNLCMLLLCVMLSVVFNLSTKCSRFYSYSRKDALTPVSQYRFYPH